MVLFFAALLGFIAILFGTYAQHGLIKKLDTATFDIVMTAVRYNQQYALLITAFGLAFIANSTLVATSLLLWSAWGFIIGSTLFSSGIYLSVITNKHFFRGITPIGGTILMLSWLMLAYSALDISGAL